MRKAVFNYQLAIAQAEFQRTMHTMVRQERPHRAEVMVKECLKAAGLNEKDIDSSRQ